MVNYAFLQKQSNYNELTPTIDDSPNFYMIQNSFIGQQ